MARLGETIRGTAMGVIETETNPKHTEYEEMARQGRLETEQGLKMWRGTGDPQAGTGTDERPPPGYDAQAPGQAANAQDGAGEDRFVRPSVGENKAGGQVQPSGIQGDGGAPAVGAYHQREDAVSGFKPPSDGQHPQNAGQPASMTGRDQK
ncbi:hypothetical protein H0H81_000263 [Sphagnurus paluster]|uniref:Uncharacterized protein n=1 Tax=Sphagnurus paluster TaxID=117069 RepID=A0A9P7KIY6_9AGAR|nr:hypothetical protein H0H81_000263 [Sphagnurus paluster]